MTSYFSLTMLGLILPGTAVAYQVMPRRARWAVLLAASYVTFWAISGKLLAFLLASTVTIWLCGLALDREIKQRGEALRAPGANRKAVKQSYARRMRLIMAAGAAVNLGMLFAFKYVVFAHRLLAPLAAPLLTHLGIDWAAPAAIAAPIGISFYTLQAVSYLVDVYRQSVTADRNLCRLALFMAFFPQIMEGPICRYGQTAQALWAGHGITWENLVSGSQRILWGAAKKLIVADRVNLLVKTVFASYESYDGGIIALAAVLYTIQLYCDFSGTMDFVVGTGRIFGVRLPENFRQPFFSRTASEFWQRWHISLGSFFRDYLLYVPFFGKPRKYFGLFLVWFCTGLWHGAAWNFILWGLYYGCFMLFEQKMGKKRMKKWPIVWKHVYTKLVIILGFGIFYFEDLGQLGQFFLNITGISMIANGAPFTDPMTFSSLRNNIFLILFAILVSLPVLPKIKSYFLESKNDTVYAIGRVGSVAVCMVLLAVVSVLLVDTTNNVFLYFRF